MLTLKTCISMEKYKFTGTITVYGAMCQDDAIDILQVMLDDFHDMNPGAGKIIIHWDKIEKVD